MFATAAGAGMFSFRGGRQPRYSSDAGPSCRSPAVVDLRTFGANIYLLIGLLICGAALIILIVAAWTALKIAVWRSSQRKAAEQEHRRKLGPDGQPYPPAAPGICERCQQAGDVVYHLPTGERLCARCYQGQREPGKSTDVAEKG
jgi:hypothetical protein